MYLHARLLASIVQEGRGLVKADEAGPGISVSVRDALGKLSAAAEAEKDFVVAAKYYERLLVVQESLHNATQGRGTRADHATAYTEAMQATLVKLGMRKSLLLTIVVCASLWSPPYYLSC